MSKPFPLRLSPERAAPPLIGTATRRAGWARVAAGIAHASDAIADSPRSPGWARFCGGAFVGLIIGAGIVLAILGGA
jgi:hypothetical protein